MATLTTAWADHYYNHANRGISPPSLTAGVYLRLFTADPTDAGAFDDEVTGGTYTGQDITAAMDVPDNGTGVSIADVTFTGMPAITITHWAKCKSAADTSDPDEMIETGPLVAPITTTAGQTLTIAAGDLHGGAA